MAGEDSGPATSSHMMKTTKRGRPYLKDTMDLFATLIVSLTLQDNRQYFRVFPNSFTTDQAAANLNSLKFSQSNRGPDPRDPVRIVTTTTTTTFSMTRDMAKAMCQHFMDARLIENAADPGSNLFKDRGTYVLTPKGLHVLERFITKNGINGDHLSNVFATQPICMKLLHLERRMADDEIIVSQSVIYTLFRRFAGLKPNYPPANPAEMDAHQLYSERARGIAFHDVQDRNVVGSKGQGVHKYCFQAVAALEWLCDFTSVVGREEAAEMAAQFVRFGLIALVSDKRKNNDSAIIFTVRGTAPGGDSPIKQIGEFRCTQKAVYKFTDEGRRVARWEQTSSPNTSTANLSATRTSEDGHADADKVADAGAKLSRRMSMAEGLNQAGEGDKKVKESNTDRLRYILEEPALRSLFRDYLRANYCEENLSFYMDVLDFKRKFNITSSAVASGSDTPQGARGKHSPGQQAMERHHEALIQQAFVIHEKYLSSVAPSELNIDHNLRNELGTYLGEMMAVLAAKSANGRVGQEQMSSFNATQLQTMIRMYERIQTHVFRLMATDSVPKFIKTPSFLKVRRQFADEFDRFDNDELHGRPHPPGLNGEEVGGAYVTVSQQASERQQQREQAAALASSKSNNSPSASQF